MKKKELIQYHEHNDCGLSCGCSSCESAHKATASKTGNIYGFEIAKIVVGFVVHMFAKFVINDDSNPIALTMYIVAMVMEGYELAYKAIRNLIKGRVFDECMLMIIAGITAFIIGDYFEGVLILELFCVGELLEKVATDNSRKRIAGLAELKSTCARLVTKNGIEEVLPETVEIGSLIEVRRGDIVAIDGILIGLSAHLDMKAVTGESNYYNLKNGDKIYSGAINVGDSIIVKTQKLYKDSNVEQIIAMVEGANAKKAKSQKFIANFAKYYTPIVVILALAIATIVPIFDNLNFSFWVYKALSFVVISCPCALVISVPLAFFTGIGSLSMRGALIKGSVHIDNISQVKTVVFDKTGTLTKGTLEVQEIICSKGYDKNQVLSLLKALEQSSSHPIAKAILNVAKGVDSNLEVLNVAEVAGRGVRAEINGKAIVFGNFALMKEERISVAEGNYLGTINYLAIASELVAEIRLSDTIKSEARETVQKLKLLGVNRIVMLSGDNDKIANEVAQSVGINEVYSQLLPAEKSQALQKIIEQSKGKVMFCGDGINDAPSLALADVGVAMGGLGSGVAIESADVVVMDDNLKKLPTLIRHSKKITRSVKINMFGSILLKVAVMILSLVITLPVWIAMIADVGVMLLAVANSLTNYKVANK